MLLWIIFALMTVAVLTALVWPVLRARHADAAREAFDAQIYKDQLSEIEAERERGQLSEAEAEAARIEISRRLLAVAGHQEAGGSGDAQAAKTKSPGAAVRYASVAAFIAVPVVSAGLYLALGSPGLPDQPHAARLQAPTGNQDIATLIGRVEERLRQQPGDGRGWDVIAPVYLKRGRHQDAASAFDNAIRILGESAIRLTGLGEALVRLNGGVVPDRAKRAFTRALQLDDDLVTPRIRLAEAHEQDGDMAAAAKAWADIKARSPEDTPWAKMVARRLSQVEAKLGPGAKTAEAPDGADTADAAETARTPEPDTGSEKPAPGPSAEDVAAASRMSEADRAQMINQMVDGLAARLRDEGGQVADWVRLVRSYIVLGKEGDARKALADARESFKGDKDALGTLDAAAKALGLES